jgi:PKD repeat protein
MYTSILIALFCQAVLLGQITEFKAVVSEKNKIESSDELFTEVDIVYFNARQLHKHLKDPSKDYYVTIDLGKGMKWELELFPRDMFTENAQIRLLGESGETSIPVPRDVVYYGHIKDQYQSTVLLVVHNDYINGYIDDGNKRIRIESATNFFKSAEKNEYLVFDPNNLKEEKTDHGCGTELYPEFTVLESKEKKDKVGQNSANEKMAGDCYRVELGVVSDYLMYLDQGSTPQGCVDHVLSVMADVATNYELNGSTNFDDGIVYFITEQVISTCATCDPWTSSTSASAFLNDFTAWAQDGGFNNNVDMGSAWTDRNFNGSTVGLAWTGSGLLCGNLAYHVVQDYTNTAGSLRVMTAHEMGHNWSAGHNSTSNTRIMDPSVNGNAVLWTSQSQTSINAVIANQGPSCLDIDCPASTCDSIVGVSISNITNTGFNISFTGTSDNSYRIRVRDEEDLSIIHTVNTGSESLTVTPPGWEQCHNYKVILENNCGGGDYGPITSALVSGPTSQGCARFSVDKNVDWSSGTFNFTDESSDATSWNWDFGDSNTSSAQNPVHTYNSPGLYTVELNINSGANSETKTDYIYILPTEQLPYTLGKGGDMNDNDFGTESITAGKTSLFEKGIPSNYFSHNNNCWVTDLDADLPIEENESVIYSPEFNFTGVASATLLFELGMEITFCNAPFGVQVQYSTNGGTSWTRLGSSSDPSWYNRGPSTSCPLNADVFSDNYGWSFTTSSSNTNGYSYNVGFLSGNSSVLFRWVFSLDGENGWSSSGYARDGALLDDVEISAVVPVNLLSFE